MQRPCEREWSIEKATRTRQLIERLTGEDCPCIQGKACPVLPMVDPSVVLPTPQMRHAIIAVSLAAVVAAMKFMTDTF